MKLSLNRSLEIVLVLSALLCAVSCTTINETTPKEDSSSSLGVSEPTFSNKDLSYLVPEVGEFEKSFLRSGEELQWDQELEKYDFSNSSVLTSPSRITSIASIPSENEGEYLILRVDRELGITSVNTMSCVTVDDVTTFSFQNEVGEEIFSAAFNTTEDTFTLLSVAPEIENAGFLRASAAQWGCGMSLGVVGGMWGTVIGMACPPAGFAVGLAYTAFSIWACDHLD